MRFEAHCAQTKATFGETFPHIHQWLDEFAGAPGIGMRHRRKRHHLAGIEDVRRQWGAQAAEVARQHIEADLQEEGWRVGDHFPADERDYQRMGLY